MSVLTLLMVACGRGPSESIPDVSSDDARLCACLVDGSDCVNLSFVNFGVVALGRTKTKQLRLSACGTQPVTIETVQFSGDWPTFAMTGIPAANTVLQPGAAPFDLEVSFTPVLPQSTTGRFSFHTATEPLNIDLLGTGVDGRCKLTASSVSVAFADTVVGGSSLMELELTNEGLEYCTFPVAPVVTSDENETFGIVNTPTEPLADGASVKLTLAYTPHNTTPDVGKLILPYADTDQTPLGSLELELTGTATPAPTCELDVQPNGTNGGPRILDFGTVLVNKTKRLPVTLTNVGNGACSLTDVQRVAGPLAISGLLSKAYEVVSWPMKPIAPGTTATIEVSFTPDREGDFGSPFTGGPPYAYSINLIVRTSDTTHYSGSDCTSASVIGATAGCIAWALAGKGGQPRIELMSTPIDLGEVTVGCRSSEAQITLFNTGSSAATIKGIHIDPPPPVGQAPLFSLVLPTLPISLAPGAQLNIPVRFAPSTTGHETVSLMIEYDFGIVTASMKATGTLVSQDTETFTQGTIAKNDILFVVDNSGSMAEEQVLLSTNAQAFIDKLNQSSVDFQIAVVTTDVASANQRGQFQGTPKIITPGIDAATHLANRITALGTNGSADEQGLWATYLALTYPLISDPTQNAGFLRPDARLSVIIVSDEDDSSPAAPSFYKQFLWSLKAKDLVSLSAIVGNESTGCTSPNGDATAGTRYLSVQQATGGQFQSICTPNWTLLAETLAFQATTLPNRFKLSREPDVASLSVSVNGTASSITDWTWDAATNAIVFNAGAVPAAGDSVEVTYDAACN